MMFKKLQMETDDMYMVLNDQSVSDDFITMLKWQDLEECIEELFMINKVSIFKIKVKDREEYNQYLISYLQGMRIRNRSARNHFPFEERIEVSPEKDNGIELTDALFNIMADGHKIDYENSEITLTDNFKMTEDIKYVMKHYGFNMRIIK